MTYPETVRKLRGALGYFWHNVFMDSDFVDAFTTLYKRSVRATKPRSV